jgi:hypothetical protein
VDAKIANAVAENEADLSTISVAPGTADTSVVSADAALSGALGDADTAHSAADSVKGEAGCSMPAT